MNDRTTKYLCITLLLWIGFSLSATAGEATAAAVGSAPAAAGAGSDAKAVDNSDGANTKVGTRTARLLDIQREGRAAGNMLAIPPAQAARSYQRYLDSFATPIPDQLSSQAPGLGAKR